MLKLKRLKVHKYRIVKPGTELRFNDGSNVLVGKNGTGKTTLLELIARASFEDFADLSGEEFDVEIEIDVPNCPGTLQMRVTNLAMANAKDLNQYQISLVFSSKEPDRWPDFQLSADRATAHLTLAGKTQRFALSPSRCILTALRQLRGFDNDVINVLLQLTPQERYDEALVWTERMWSRAGFECAPSSSRTHSLPWELAETCLSRIRSLPQATPPPDILTIKSAEIPSLHAMMTSLEFQEASFHLDLKSQQRQDSGYSVAYNNLRIFLTKRDGTRLPFEALSFGQKRLLGFFYYLTMFPATYQIVIADELANGMHHKMIEQCLDTIGDRQAFLATQHPLLLDLIGFDSSEEVQRSFILCESQVEEGREQFIWSQMSANEANDLYQDWLVGIQHTNDILRKRGLW